MYSFEERRIAIELYIKYELQVNPVVKELGYPSRRILYKWYKEYLEKGDIPKRHAKKSKYSNEQKCTAIEYYFEHGKSLSHTIRVLGYPTKMALRSWIDESSPVSSKRCDTSKYMVRYSQDKKKQAAFDLCERNTSAENVARSHGGPRSTIYEWKKKLLGAKRIEPMSQKQDITIKEGSKPSTTLEDEKTVFEQQVETLKKKYAIKTLLRSLNMAKSSYFYHEKALHKIDKYKEVRKAIERIFNDSGKSYVHRRVYAILKEEGTRISEKVVRKIMHENLLMIQVVKKRKYNSYKGEITPAVNNVINRDFHANSQMKNS